MGLRRLWTLLKDSNKGYHNSKRILQLGLDKFIQLSSLFQIFILLVIVTAIFVIAICAWVYFEKNDPSEPVELVAKVNTMPTSELAADASHIGVQNNNEESGAVKVSDPVVEVNEAQSDSEETDGDISSSNETFNETPNETPNEITENSDNTKANLNDAQQTVNSTSEAEVTGSGHEWVDKTYDVFVQSINPSSSKEIRSLGKEAIVFILFLITSFGISGLLFTILINMFERRKEKWENGDINYKITKDFILIIGGHKMVDQLCADLLSPKEPKLKENVVIVIQTRRKAIMLRKELEAKIGTDLAKRVFIYNGDRTSWDNLKILNPQFAKQIFIIGEERIFDGNSHDAFSLQCLNLIDKMIENYHGDSQTPTDKIPCHVMFEYQNSTKVFQYTDRALCPWLDFIPFNYYEKWAAQVLVHGKCPQPISETNRGDDAPNVSPQIKYKSILGEDPTIFQNTDKKVHIIIIGMSKMGTMFGAMAAHVCHFPNFFKSKRHPRTLITFIDREGKTEMNYFKGRNPALCELSRWRYVDADDYMNRDQVAVGSIYQKNPNFIVPMQQKGADSDFLNCKIDPNLMDIDWEFIKGDVGTPSVQKYLHDAAEDDECVTTIAVCIPVTYEAVSAAMFMPENVYKSKNITQILVLQQSSDSVVRSANQEIKTKFFQKINTAKGNEEENRDYLSINPYEKLLPFGMFDQCSYLDHLDLLPMIINLIYSQELYNENGDLISKEEIQSLFDKLGHQLIADLEVTKKDNKPFGIIKVAKEKYDKLDTGNGKSVQAQRASNIYNYYSMLYKAKVLGIKPNDKPLNRLNPEQDKIVDMLAEVEHNRWDTEQLFVGYRPQKTTDKAEYSLVKRIFIDDKGKENPFKVSHDLKLRRIHPEIHSYQKTECDPGLTIWTRIYDITIAMMTPVLLKIYYELQSWE